MNKIELSNLDLTKEISDIVKKYNQECMDKLELSSQEIGKECVNKLKNTTTTYKVRTGKYNKGWRLVHTSGSYEFNTVVHNATCYQLTHLLENGHVAANKYGIYGIVEAYPHIGKVQDEASKSFLKEAQEIFGGKK